MNKKKQGDKQGEKTYQIRPVFTKKFRPQVSIIYFGKIIYCDNLGSKRKN